MYSIICVRRAVLNKRSQNILLFEHKFADRVSDTSVIEHIITQDNVIRVMKLSISEST